METSATTKPVLDYLVREPKIKTKNPPLIILLHGAGSNERDLFSFADLLPENFLVISARGPIKYAPSKYSWYAVDFSTGKPVINQTQELESRKIILRFINELKSLHRFDEKKIFLGGFSQGAIMSYSIGLTHPEIIHGIVAMGGRILEEVKPLIGKSTQSIKPHVFIAHGMNDNVLPVDYARVARMFLKERGINADYREYEVGHSVNSEMINDLADWLKKN
jgi:phospholipase/carboxylesterase